MKAIKPKCKTAPKPRKRKAQATLTRIAADIDALCQYYVQYEKWRNENTSLSNRLIALRMEIDRLKRENGQQAVEIANLRASQGSFELWKPVPGWKPFEGPTFEVDFSFPPSKETP